LLVKVKLGAFSFNPAVGRFRAGWLATKFEATSVAADWATGICTAV
jgi:hypothetical protein